MVPRSTDVLNRWLEPLTAAADCEAAWHGYLTYLKDHDVGQQKYSQSLSEIRVLPGREGIAEATDVQDLLVESLTAATVYQTEWRRCLE